MLPLSSIQIHPYPTQCSTSYLTSKQFKKQPKLSNLKNAMIAYQSKNLKAKNKLEETFESDQARYKNENQLDEKQIYLSQTDFTSKKKENIQDFTNNLISIKKPFIRHHKSLLASNQPHFQKRSIKTQMNQFQSKTPIFFQKLQKQSKFQRDHLIRRTSLCQNISINQVMIKKFQPERHYQNSKNTYYGILPSFLNYSISKSMKCQRKMISNMRRNKFGEHRVYFENKYIYL